MDSVKIFEVKKYNLSKYNNDDRFLNMEMWICCSNKKANDSIFSDESIESSYQSFAEVPVVGYISNDDFKGHEMKIQIDRDGTRYNEYIETNVGFVKPETVRIVNDEKNPSQKWIVANALIWAERNYKLTKIIKNRRSVSVSMEVKFNSYKTIDGIDYVDSFTALGVTLLGKHIRPAFGTSVANLTETFADFKTAMCFALNKEGDNVEIFLDKEQWGTGEAIKIDKSKESMSNSSWGDVDKTALRNKVLKASNYRSLIKSIYAKIEEGWEEHPSSSLKYPIMQIVGETAVYNSGALKSAQGYAEANNESAVVSKVKSIRKKLGLLEEGGGKSVDKEKVMEAFNQVEGYQFFECGEKAVYAIKEGKVYAIPFEIVDDTVKMEEDKVVECSVNVQYNVETLKEEEKSEDMVLDVDTEDAETNLVLIEEFGCGGKFAELISGYESKISEYAEKAKEAEDKAKEKEEEDKEKEEEFAALKAKFAEMENKLAEYANKEVEEAKAKFAEDATAILSKFELREDFKAEWQEKISSYEDLTIFEKELVYAIYSTDGVIKKAEIQEGSTVAKFAIDNTHKSKQSKEYKTPMDAVRDLMKLKN